MLCDAITVIGLITMLIGSTAAPEDGIRGAVVALIGLLVFWVGSRKKISQQDRRKKN